MTAGPLKILRRWSFWEKQVNYKDGPRHLFYGEFEPNSSAFESLLKSSAQLF